MSLESTVKTACVKQGTSLRKLAVHIDMSETNLYRCFRRNSIETKHLLKIAEALKVPASYLLGESPASAPDSFQVNEPGTLYNNDCRHKIELLEQKIQSMTEIIKAKDELILYMKKTINQKNE